ncbi:BnaC05g18880D [Brassica napus]|uniref:BnaC05g18880D protein n=1 Tax=Brassica napus TaxID=3708 RepID=A0A078IBY8_BRANA|nr:BnaC05g18880D [Brassica napus]
MADTKPGLRKPAFTKVDQLRPGTSGHNVSVKIVSTNGVTERSRRWSSGSRCRRRSLGLSSSPQEMTKWT